MSQAFVLIISELGTEAEVREAYQVHGVYDIIIRVEAENMQELREIVTQRIKPLNRIRSTMTLICSDPGGGG